MASIVGICNAALALLGGQTIASLTESSQEARLCNAVFEPLRDELLRAHPWNFAMARASLAADATAPAWGYARSFTLPADPYCLALREVDGTSVDDPELPWTVEGRKILANLSAPLLIRYTARISDSEQFDASFVAALQARIAMQIAVPLTGNRQNLSDMSQLFQGFMRQARSADGQEGAVQIVDAPTFINARF